MTVAPASSQLIVFCREKGEAKNRVHHRSTWLHLAFSAYVFDNRARLLVTRRTYGKQTWPGVLTNKRTLPSVYSPYRYRSPHS